MWYLGNLSNTRSSSLQLLPFRITSFILFWDMNIHNNDITLDLDLNGWRQLKNGLAPCDYW
jgi:hypothetical protein